MTLLHRTVRQRKSQGCAEDGCASCLQESWSVDRSSQPHIPHLSKRITTLLHRMVTRIKIPHFYEVSLIRIHLNIFSSPCGPGGLVCMNRSLSTHWTECEQEHRENKSESGIGAQDGKYLYNVVISIFCPSPL